MGAAEQWEPDEAHQIPSGKVERGDREQTADDVSKAD